MFYDFLKILHILSATLFLLAVVVSCRAWFNALNTSHAANLTHNYTWNIIIPFGIFQLLSGFTMISLKHYLISELWIAGSIFCFIIFFISWFVFLLSSRIKGLQMILLALCSITLLTMIFLMANKIN